MKFQQAMECGGAYVKLLSQQDSFDLVRTQIAMSAQIMRASITVLLRQLSIQDYTIRLNDVLFTPWFKH